MQYAHPITKIAFFCRFRIVFHLWDRCRNDAFSKSEGFAGPDALPFAPVRLFFCPTACNSVLHLSDFLLSLVSKPEKQ